MSLTLEELTPSGRAAVAAVEAAQRTILERSGRARARWRRRGQARYLDVDGVVFVASEYESNLSASRATLASRAAGLFIFGSLSLFYGAYSLLGTPRSGLALVLGLAGVLSLGLGLWAARKDHRQTVAGAAGLAEKGFYLLDEGILVRGGGDLSDRFAFFPRGAVVGTRYAQLGSTSHTFLDHRSEDGREGSLDLGPADLRPVIGDWLRTPRD